MYVIGISCSRVKRLFLRINIRMFSCYLTNGNPLLIIILFLLYFKIVFLLSRYHMHNLHNNV